MIEKLEKDRTYYEGIVLPPFYKEVSCIEVNADDTYATKEHLRYGAVSTAKNHWCNTSEEAIEDMTTYYMSQFHEIDMSTKAIIYQNFQKSMEIYLRKTKPEYFL